MINIKKNEIKSNEKKLVKDIKSHYSEIMNTFEKSPEEDKLYMTDMIDKLNSSFSLSSFLKKSNEKKESKKNKKNSDFPRISFENFLISKSIGNIDQNSQQKDEKLNENNVEINDEDRPLQKSITKMEKFLDNSDFSIIENEKKKNNEEKNCENEKNMLITSNVEENAINEYSLKMLINNVDSPIRLKETPTKNTKKINFSNSLKKMKNIVNNSFLNERNFSILNNENIEIENKIKDNYIPKTYIDEYNEINEDRPLRMIKDSNHNIINGNIEGKNMKVLTNKDIFNSISLKTFLKNPVYNNNSNLMGSNSNNLKARKNEFDNYLKNIGLKNKSYLDGSSKLSNKSSIQLQTL